jgi:hypothetical protein
MSDPISGSKARSCRVPGDDPEHDAPREEGAGQSEKPRLSCALDIDWQDTSSRPFGPPPPPVKRAEAPPRAPVAPEKLATNNATRTSETPLAPGGYADAGYARGGDAYYAGVAAIKGRHASGVEVETFSVSAQVGAQNEAQATAQRLGFSNSHGSVSGEVFTANAHAGFANPDGSVGLNGGAQATLVSVEGTLGGAANSVTVGVSMGGGAEASFGVRDKDNNGKPELCFRAAYGFATVGACLELPFHQKM